MCNRGRPFAVDDYFVNGVDDRKDDDSVKKKETYLYLQRMKERRKLDVKA